MSSREGRCSPSFRLELDDRLLDSLSPWLQEEPSLEEDGGSGLPICEQVCASRASGLFLASSSMLTGAGVRGCKYSGCSKCPVCAVNILITRMGSRFACRRGSRGVNKETTAPGRDFALSLVSLSSIRLLTDPEGRYFIGERALRFLCVRLLLVPNNVTIQVMFKCNPCRHVPKQTNRKTKHSCTSLNVPKDGESSQIV